MDSYLHSSLGQSRRCLFIQATALGVLLLSAHFSAAADATSPLRLWRQGASFSFFLAFPGTSAFWLCLLTVAVAGALFYRLAVRWRLRTLRQRDDEVFKLVDQWTKSLRQEVAERKQAQLALQESQKLILRQERLAAVGQLAAGLAHEFNNIMTIIQGHAGLLMENPNLDEESLASVHHISEGVDRRSELVQQMLAFSRRQGLQQK